MFFNVAVISSFGKSVNELLDKKKYSKRLINIINSSILNLVPDLNRVSHPRLLMIFKWHQIFLLMRAAKVLRGLAILQTVTNIYNL